ncbi:MAG TPA: preprotein translocase subunit SecG [Terriglobia bacterium]|nr:preprotein translocase subunit SecG [Terriglobia bacterium]
MNIWIGLVLALHILVTLLLVLIVLIQGGENVDITAAFGGVSQAAFGPRGTVSTLARATWVLAGIFMITSVTLSVWAGKRGTGSVLENSTHKAAPAPKPAAPPAKR